MKPERNFKYSDSGKSSFKLKCAVGIFVSGITLILFSSFLIPQHSSGVLYTTETLFPIEEDIFANKETELQQLKDSLVTLAFSLEGLPYQFGSKGPNSFDCSGFVNYVFGQFDLDMERTSRDQGDLGEEISLDEVQKGDLLFFTGTDKSIKTIGHVGIVVSEPSEEIIFIHSSSNGGVKISELEGHYTSRFLKAKRILGLNY